MTEIKIGDRVKVPKGTRVWDTGVKTEPTTLGRDQTVTVKDITLASDRAWMFISHEESRRASEECRQFNNYGNAERYNAACRPIHDRYLEAVFGKTGVRMVEWTGKMAVIDDVTFVPTKVAAPKAPKPVPKLQQMVKGSRWRVTQDTDLTYEIDNKDWDTARWAYMEQTKPVRTDAFSWQNDDYHGRLKKAEKHADTLHPRTISQPLGRITAGTVLEVAGKADNYVRINGNILNNPVGVTLPFTLVEGSYTPTTRLSGGLRAHYIPYKSLEPITEVISIPQVKVYVIRDSATGEYLSEIGWRANDKPLVMTPLWTKAKKHDDLGKLKTSILDWDGYYEGMPGSRPDWLGDGRKVADMPDTFEAVCFDKLSKTEIGVVESLKPWHDRVWKLRGLTLSHGSAVRKIYNTLDKAGEIGAFSHVMIVRAPQEEGRYYADEITAEDKAAFDEAVKQIVQIQGLKRGDTRKASDEHSLAIAFRDPNIAFLMKMTYQGRLPVGVIDIVNLTEALESA